MNRFVWFIVVASIFCTSARAEIPILELGRGGGVNTGRLAFQIDSGRTWLSDDQWHVRGYWEPAIGFWQGKSRFGDKQIYELALTPNFRLEKKSNSSWSAYAEYGLGIHLITGHHVSDRRDLGSNYHFGNHIGVGLRFGAHNEFDVGYRLQHLSNAGLRQPNLGINFNILHLRYSY
jgi:lipid A 3-O-deacylase